MTLDELQAKAEDVRSGIEAASARLREALLAGEDTASIRRFLSELQDELRKIEAEIGMVQAEQEAADQRRVEETARNLAQDSARRLKQKLAALEPPAIQPRLRHPNRERLGQDPGLCRYRRHPGIPPPSAGGNRFRHEGREIARRHRPSHPELKDIADDRRRVKQNLDNLQKTAGAKLPGRDHLEQALVSCLTEAASGWAYNVVDDLPR
jgi:DNA repair exonuclease SbcCD ATPase subunit